MDAVKFSEYLVGLSACSDARSWAKGKSLSEAWEQCDNPRWMLWLIGKAKISRKIVATIAVEIAETVEHFAVKYPAVAECNKATRAYLTGEITVDQLRKSRAAADAVADAAADAAAYAADAADAAYAADAYAADAYAAADAAYAADAARQKARVTNCDIIRKHIPTAEITKLLA